MLPIVLYHYLETLVGEHVISFLKGIADGTYVMADGCGDYNKLFEYERSYEAKELAYMQVHKRRQKDQKPVV